MGSRDIKPLKLAFSHLCLASMKKAAVRDFAADARLLGRILAGTPGADAQFIAQFSHPIRYILAGRIQDAGGELDDLVNDVLMLVLQNVRDGLLRDPLKLCGYSRSIARRIAYDWIERRIKQRRSIPVGDIMHRLYDPKLNPEEEFEVREQSALLRVAIGKLHPHGRELLERFYLRGQPVSQIMAEMGLTDNQFRLQKHRAKAKLIAIGPGIDKKFPSLLERITRN